MHDEEPCRALLLSALRVLAGTAQEQQVWLDRDGTPVDELALAFDDGYAPLAARWESTGGPEGVVRALRALDDQLDDMSGEDNASLWTIQAVTDAPAWTTVRVLARDALTALEADGS